MIAIAAAQCPGGLAAARRAAAAVGAGGAAVLSTGGPAVMTDDGPSAKRRRLPGLEDALAKRALSPVIDPCGQSRCTIDSQSFSHTTSACE